jgi:hypothetical protein
VLDRPSGQWRNRDRYWRSLGIRSQEGRPENLHNFSETVRRASTGTDPGTSTFSPALCEWVYRSFCPPGGRLCDPFAGGSVRGVVAAALGFAYWGIDLSPEQIDANRDQAADILSNRELFPFEPPEPEWVVGDAQELTEHLRGQAPFDLLFTSPPYGDLEVYSDDPRDLSTMPHEQFREALGGVIAAALGALRDDRFAAIVVGDIRDEDGFLRRLPEATIAAFETQGARLYNRGVAVESIGSAAVRAARNFDLSRKLANTHSDVMVFVKGDPRKASAAARGSGKPSEAVAA